MKKLLMMIGAGLILFSGCYSASSLDRKAPRRKKQPAVRKKVAQPKKSDESIDPAFDVFFRRKPQKHEYVHISESEASHIKKQQQEDDAAMRSVRGKQRLRENTRQKDWVFGTEGGSYF